MTVIQIYFCIEQLSTGLHLPSPGRKFGGFTSQEPTDKRPPRLFMTKRGAPYALTWWLKGICHVKIRTSCTHGYWGPDEDIYEDFFIDPPENARDPKDFYVNAVQILGAITYATTR